MISDADINAMTTDVDTSATVKDEKSAKRVFKMTLSGYAAELRKQYGDDEEGFLASIGELYEPYRYAPCKDKDLQEYMEETVFAALDRKRAREAADNQ